MRADHSSYIALFIRARIANYEAEHAANNSGNDDVATEVVGSFGQIYLGSKQRPCMLEELVLAHDGDPAFTQFRSKLNTFLTVFFQANGIQLPGNKRINITVDAQVWF